MDLRAKKKTQKKLTTQPISTPVEPAQPETNNSLEHSITIQCNALLYNTLQNTIKAQHTGNDFTYTSVTDLIRAALLAYQSGMELTEIEQPGKKKQTSIRVDDSLYKFYKSLPNQLRTKILEKAIRTFIKNQ
ncbi:MAG: hypothetical protein QNJ60_09235 [Xenococcaceae cyanobacterium MO_188.B19]|nr:hypothetical protein [Xenococcaceae cyanobacterium MO_188.B19]